MSLISPINKDNAQPEVKQKLDTIEKEHGMIPNAVGVLAHSKASLDMFMNMENMM